MQSDALKCDVFIVCAYCVLYARMLNAETSSSAVTEPALISAIWSRNQATKSRVLSAIRTLINDAQLRLSQTINTALLLLSKADVKRFGLFSGKLSACHLAGPINLNERTG